MSLRFEHTCAHLPHGMFGSALWTHPTARTLSLSMEPPMRSLLLSLLAACTGPGGGGEFVGGQTGEEFPVPCDFTSTIVAPDDASRTGFSAEGVITALGDTAASLTWAEGGGAALTLGLARDGEPVQLLDQEPVRADAECPDLLAIPVTLMFTTDDGAFTERWSATLYASGQTTASTDLLAEEARLTGTWASATGDAALYVHAAWADTAPSGTLAVDGTEAVASW